MFENHRVSLPEFVSQILRTTGGDFEEQADGTTLVMLAQQQKFRRITYEPEIAREDKEVELVASGSLFFEELMRMASLRGMLSRAFATPYLSPPPAASSSYRLDAKQLSRSEWVETVRTTWVFAFQISLVGEFRRDEMFLCAVDASDLRLVRRFEQTFSRLNLADAGPDPVGDRPFADCYFVARDQVQQRSVTLFKSAQRETEEFLHRDAACLSRYYDGLMGEMRQDMIRLAPEDPRRASILARLEATQLDHKRAALQASERYRMSLELDAIGALGIIYPRLVATITLSNKNGQEVEMEATWDPVFERFEPLICPSCKRATYAVEFLSRVAHCGCGVGQSVV